MKKILLMAFTEVNLGDDLFIDIICKRYPEHEFHLVCYEGTERPFINIPNLELTIIPRLINYTEAIFRRIGTTFGFMHKKMINIAKRMDAIVYIGGSLFIQGKSWERQLRRHYELLETDIPFYIIGCNFGPYQDQNYYFKHKEFFKQLEDICFRDEKSYDMFSELDNARLAPDIVFSITKEHVNNSESDMVAVSVINLEARHDLSHTITYYENFLKDSIIKLVNQGKKVVMMSFCDNQGDRIACERIYESLSGDVKESVSIYSHGNDIAESISIIENSELVIATRLHSMILGFVNYKKVLPLMYSDKMVNIINDLGYKGPSIDLRTSDFKYNLDELFERVYSVDVLNLDKVAENAENHFLKLDKFLK